MEINYATIISYLNPELNQDNKIDNKPIKSDGISTKNIISNIDFMNNSILKILQKESKFYKLGVTNKINFENKNCNISFITSILSVIDENYVVLDEKEEKQYLRDFIAKIKETITNSSFKFELKYKFPKTVLMDRILDLSFEDTIIYQVIVQILDINLIIFPYSDINEKGFKTLFPEYTMNPWKPTIMLYMNDKSFEPIMSENKKKISFSDNFIKELFTTNFTNIEYLNSKFLNKDFSINDDFYQTLDEFILESNYTVKDEKDDNIKIAKESNDKVNNNNTEFEEDSSEISKDFKKTILENKKIVDEHINKELNNLEIKKIENKEDTIKKIYKKNELDKLKKEDILALIKSNPQLLSKFNKINKNILKKDLIDKFIFYQNLLKNQNSI